MADTPIYQSTGVVYSSSANWNRRYRLRIYVHSTNTVKYQFSSDEERQAYNEQFNQEQYGDMAFQIPDDQYSSQEPLRIQFKIQRYAMYYPNQALITVYNLSSAFENAIILQGYRITLEAGYGTSDASSANYGQIFDGQILMCTRWKQNATDYILQILALDGGQFLSEGYCSFSYTKGQTMRGVIKDMASKAAVPVSEGYVSPALEKYPLMKGIAVNGLARNAYNDFARTANATWFIDNGKLYFIPYAESADSLPFGLEAVELSPATGLLGNPMQSQQCITATCLLNPQIIPYSLVHISNELITQQLVDIQSYSQGVSTPWMLDPEGIYRVISVVFTGDNRGQDWKTDLTAVTQTGNIPEILQSADSTAN